MKEELIVIDTLKGLEDLSSYIDGTDFIAYDSETTGLTKRDHVIGFSICASESLAYYVILYKWDLTEKTLKEVIPLAEAKKIIEKLQHKNIIAHNGVFDCMMAEAFFKISLIKSLHTDTMILAHLLNENRSAALKSLAKEYFGETSTTEETEMKASIVANGGICTRNKYELYKADPYLIAKYGAKDALLTFKLFMRLLPELYAQELDKYFYEDESMPLLRGPTYELNTTGLQIDNSKLVLLKKTVEAEILEARNFIYSEIDKYVKGKYPGDNKKNAFNIESSQQLAWLLFGQLKLEYNVLTPSGKKVCKALGLKLPYTKKAKQDFIELCLQNAGREYEPEVTINGKKSRAKIVKEPWSYITCDKFTLTKLASRYKWIAKLLEYKKNQKILSTYIEGIEERVQYGVIYPSFLQHGTKTGRYSSQNPNFQNLPRTDKRVKSFITARPGKVFVGADYSQLEPRIFAYYSQDERLLEVFNSNADFYSVIGIETYEKYECVPLKEGPKNAFGIMYPSLRDDTKVIALSTVYGTTAFKLSKTLGRSVEDTEEIINRYFERFPRVRQMMDDRHEEVKKQGFVTNIFGRPRRIPQATKISHLYGPVEHDELPREARTLLNQAVNAPIQSTAGSLINRACIKMEQYKQELELNCKLVTQVHDSLIYECDEKEAEQVSLLLQDAMEETNRLQGLRLEAIPKIGLSLADV